MLKGFDTASCCTKVAKALVDDGMQFAIRYYTRFPDWRTLRTEERRALHDVGLAILPVYEHSDKLEHFTPANAVLDHAAATKTAANLGQPERTTIIYAVDTDVIPSTLDNVRRYVDTLATMMPMTGWDLGIYGDPDVLDIVLADHPDTLRWLPNAVGWRAQHQRNYDGWDILQKAQRKHPCGLLIDDDEAYPEVLDYSWRPH